MNLPKTCLAATVPTLGEPGILIYGPILARRSPPSQLIDATLEGGTLLLTNEQDPINRLGVAYLGANFGRQDLIVGRRMVDPPDQPRRQSDDPADIRGRDPALRLRKSREGSNMIADYFQAFKQVFANFGTRFRACLRATQVMRCTTPLPASPVAPRAHNPTHAALQKVAYAIISRRRPVNNPGPALAGRDCLAWETQEHQPRLLAAT